MDLRERKVSIYPVLPGCQGLTGCCIKDEREAKAVPELPQEAERGAGSDWEDITCPGEAPADKGTAAGHCHCPASLRKGQTSVKRGQWLVNCKTLSGVQGWTRVEKMWDSTGTCPLTHCGAKRCRSYAAQGFHPSTLEFVVIMKSGSFCTTTKLSNNLAKMEISVTPVEDYRFNRQHIPNKNANVEGRSYMTYSSTPTLNSINAPHH